jgi:hypothetical protein
MTQAHEERFGSGPRPAIDKAFPCINIDKGLAEIAADRVKDFDADAIIASPPLHSSAPA